MNTVQHSQARLLHKAARRLLDTFLESVSLSAGDFAKVEEAARVTILDLRCSLLSAGLQLSAENSRAAPYCPECGAALRGWSMSPRRVVTAQGEAAYRPIRY